MNTTTLLASAIFSSSLLACGASAPKESDLKFNIAWSNNLGSVTLNGNAMASMANDGSFAVISNDGLGESASLTRYSSANQPTYSHGATSASFGAVAAASDGSTYVTVNDRLEKLDPSGNCVWALSDPDLASASYLREIDSGSIVGFSAPGSGIGGAFFSIAPDQTIQLKKELQIPWKTPFAISHDGELAVATPCSDGSGATCIYSFDQTGVQLELARTQTFGVSAIAWTLDDGLVLGAGTSTQSSVLDVLGLPFDSTSFQNFIVRLAPSREAMWVQPTTGNVAAIDASVGQITVACALASDGTNENVYSVIGYSLDGTLGPSIASNLNVMSLTGGQEGRVLVAGFLDGIVTDNVETVTGDDASVVMELALH